MIYLHNTYYDIVIVIVIAYYITVLSIIITDFLKIYNINFSTNHFLKLNLCVVDSYFINNKLYFLIILISIILSKYLDHQAMQHFITLSIKNFFNTILFHL